jgi:RNA polymerase sigma factor (sigma-70 family)
MNDLSIEDLLLIISDQKEDKERSQNGFVELYRRFSEDVTQSVAGFLKSKGIFNDELHKSIVSNVFLEVYENPLSFNYDNKSHQSEESAFKAWLYIIARNEFADLMRHSIKYTETHTLGIESDLIERYAEIDIEEEVLSGNRKLLDSALSVLSDRERHILLACFDYYEDGKNTPSDVLDYLCEYWGTTRDNVRQIKKRSLDKVRLRLEVLSKTKTEK